MKCHECSDVWETETEVQQKESPHTHTHTYTKFKHIQLNENSKLTDGRTEICSPLAVEALRILLMIMKIEYFLAKVF